MKKEKTFKNIYELIVTEKVSVGGGNNFTLVVVSKNQKEDLSTLIISAVD